MRLYFRKYTPKWNEIIYFKSNIKFIFHQNIFSAVFKVLNFDIYIFSKIHVFKVCLFYILYIIHSMIASLFSSQVLKINLFHQKFQICKELVHSNTFCLIVDLERCLIREKYFATFHCQIRYHIGNRINSPIMVAYE